MKKIRKIGVLDLGRTQKDLLLPVQLSEHTLCHAFQLLIALWFLLKFYPKSGGISKSCQNLFFSLSP